MAQIIHLLIYIAVFAVIAYGMHWVCTRFSLPQPVLWICGVILLIMLLLFLANQLGISTTAPILKGN